MEPQSIQEPIDAVVPRSGRTQRWVFAVPIAIAVYLIGLAIYLSSRRVMWLDEFFAWGILTDPSLKHAMHAWLEGADSGGVLYYILGHTLLSITGPSVLAARLFGAVLLAGAYVLWFRILLRVFSGRVALIGSGVLLLSAGYINYLAEVRFYSQLMAAVVLAIWLAFWVQRENRPSGFAFVVFFLVHAALVSSHLLGVVYSAMLLAGMLLCAKPQRYVAAALGVVVSWSLLLFAREPIHVGGARVAGMLLPPPRWGELFQFYQSQPTGLFRANLLLYGVLIVSAALWLWRRKGGWPLQDDARSLLFRISLLLGATPLLFLVESRVAPWSLWVVRYMLPCVLGISGLTAFAVAFQSRQAWAQRLGLRLRDGIFAVMLMILVAWHIEGVRHQVFRHGLTKAQMEPFEKNLPVVVADVQLFFQLKFYESDVLPHVYYVHIPLATAAAERNDLMRTIERQGYWDGSLRSRDEFLADATDFLLLEYPGRDADLIEQLRGEGWTVSLLGTENLEGRETSILRLTRPKA